MTTLVPSPFPLSEDVRSAVLHAEGSSLSQCLVCYSDLYLTTKTPCDHNEICGVCHLRLRFLHKDKKCPICKQENETVIVDYADGNEEEEEEHQLFAEYPVWGNELGGNFIFRQDVGMFFPKSYFQTDIKPLFGYHCTFPNCKFDGAAAAASVNTSANANAKNDNNTHSTNTIQDAVENAVTTNANNSTTAAVRALQNHLRDAHRTAMCNLCVENCRDFVVNLPRFTSHAMKQHLTKGDGPESGFTGHPVCEFCRPTRFYDLTQLHQHLAKDHYKCHVCQQQGLDNQYFKDYRTLERHFDHHHFLCHDVQCLTARFVVFPSELDLRHHERQVHGGHAGGGSTKIQLQFRVRRNHAEENNGAPQHVPDDSDFGFGVDGEAFVPPALPPSRPGELPLHPLHVQRTRQLQQQALSLRRSSTGSRESFPALAATEAGENEPGDSAAAILAKQQQRIRLGWNEGANTTLQRVGRPANVGAATREEFPALPTPTVPRTTASRSPAYPAIPGSRSSNSSSNNTARSFLAGNSSWGAGISNATALPSTISQAPTLGTASSKTATTSTVPLSLSKPVVKHQGIANSTANLAAENFPALGPPSSRPTAPRLQYPALSALSAKKNSAAHQNAVLDVSLSNFPSLGLAGNTTSDSAVAKTTPLPHQKPPSLNNTVDFPAFGASVSGKSGKGTHTKGKTAVSADFAKAAKTDSSSDSKAKLTEMKETMGVVKYKHLKLLTKEFAAGDISPESYVDQSAALFKQGSNDENFWNFMPSLLESCPDLYASSRAKRYMETLNSDTSQKQNTNATANLVTPASQSSWANNDASNTDEQRQVEQKPPALDSNEEFPPPPSSITTSNPPHNEVQQSGRPVSKKAAAHSFATVSKADPMAQSKATVADIKAKLGPKFKQLKALTKQFASAEIKPENYIDEALTLFELGINDPAFWSFVPSLLESCPDLYASARASRYMESLKEN